MIEAWHATSPASFTKYIGENNQYNCDMTG